MTKTQSYIGVNKQHHNLSLMQYIHRRNGVPLGHPKSLKNMLYRSFGASSFAKFWQYWNPIWGYALGKFVHAPLRRYLSPSLALLMTFTVSGSIHDLATMAVRGSVTLFFTPWFFLLGLGVVLGRFAKMNLSKYSWSIRTSINLIYLIIGIWTTLLIKNIFNIP